MDSTLLKGLSLLELLATSDRPRGISELADELGWAKSNVHRVVQTLSHAGYVSKDPQTGRYLCTLKLMELGSLMSERMDIRSVARANVCELAAKTSECVHLSILDGMEVLYIDKVESDQPVRSYTRIGGRAPAHCVATGKALLAFCPEDTLPRRKLKAHTPRTISDWTQLSRELRRVRENGYAINRGEWREDVHGLASPILDGRARPLAAIGISGPWDRLNLTRMRELAPMIVEAAANVARDLGVVSR